MANLFYQMYSSIEDAFGDDGGTQKREIKMDDQQDTKDFVFSRSEWKRLKDAASDFSDWLKESHPDIKKVVDIDREIAKEFLLDKHRFNGGTCNSNTCNTLSESLDKLSHLVDQKFGIKTDWDIPRAELIQDGEKLRGIRMDTEHLAEALDNMKCNTWGRFGVEIAQEFGLRASEIPKIEVRDVDFTDHVLHIVDSKGGKDRDLPMSPDQEAMFREHIEAKGLTGDMDRLVPIRADSICDLLSRNLEKTGHGEYKLDKTSIHAVRKMVAQQHYIKGIQDYLAKGESFKDAEKHALQATSNFLGHGDKRTIGEYVDRFGSEADFEAAGH